MSHARSSQPKFKTAPRGGLETTCAWAGCDKPGVYPAPRDRHLTDRYMFCLDHVRLYNAQWDFHRGLSPAEMEAELQHPATWGRPTWKLGTLGGGARKGRRLWSGKFRVEDPLDLGAGTAFDDDRAHHAGASGGRTRGANAEETRALKLMGLALPLTLDVLRRRYKALVKLHHPDANGGSAAAETRMKRINAAYETLRSALAARS